MVTIRNIDVFKMSFFLGLFGVFAGVALAVIQIILWSLSLPLLGFYGLFGNVILPFFGFWMSMILYPVAYGICFFLCGLIFVPLANLTLRILGGVDISTGFVDKNPKLQKVFKK